MSKQGFYVVLFLCIGIVGVSAYLAISSGGQPNPNDPSGQVQQIPGGGLSQQIPNATPMPSVSFGIGSLHTQAPAPSPSPIEPSQNQAQASVKLGVPVEGEIIKEFANDSLLYSKTLNQWMTHSGVDIAAAEGVDVMAALAGTVESVENDTLRGVTVTLSHSGGGQTVYSNLAETDTVAAGDKVTKGQVIGKIGKTAKSEILDESHLHFEYIVNGTAKNPEQYLEKILKSSSNSQK